MKKLKRRYIFPACAVSGALTGMTVSYILPSGFEYFTMIPFFIVLLLVSEGELPENHPVRGGHPVWGVISRGIFMGFSYFYPFYLVVWHWLLTMYPLDFTGMSSGAALAAILIAWLGLPLLQTCVAMLWAPVCLFISRSTASRGNSLGKRGLKLLFPLLSGCVYIFFEWTETLTWAGVPWGRLAIGQAYTPIFIQSASLFGSYVISLVVVLVNAYIALGILAFAHSEKKRAAISGGVAAAVFTSNLLVGAVILAAREADEAEDAVTFAAIQGNVSSREKWSEDWYFEDYAELYSELSIEAAEAGADVILWTETSLPYSINIHSYMTEYLEELADECDAVLLATAFWREVDEDGESITYNTVIKVTPDEGIDTENIYFKRRLVPFGEFVPYENLIKVIFPPLTELGMFGSSITTGDEATIIPTEYGNIGALVCFDSIYENLARSSVLAGAEIITISTNDSWFGDSAALYQHTAQAILRAVENDRWVVRAGNTGYTCVISPSGEIINDTEINERTFIISEVYSRDTTTLYTATGNILVFAAALASLAAVTDGCVRMRCELKERKNKSEETA
ncbi:MAG: apolipoprotein N-acyltransferase [Firmicutes bacterium]|nr:apolipoprotein N-acyltransferase [Bacillota bacterium]